MYFINDSVAVKEISFGKANVSKHKMKRHIIAFNIVLLVSLKAFSQDSPKHDTFHLSTSSIAFQRSDTVYYKEGEIKYVTFYPRTEYSIGKNLLSSFEFQKKVFQYDKCGNLRNISEIVRYTRQITSCYDYYYNHPYQVTDNIITNVDCIEPWTKPLIL